jgi:hypothetical protein
MYTHSYIYALTQIPKKKKQHNTTQHNSTDKGMKLEWATVKDGRLVLGSFGKEYTAPGTF